MRPRRGGYRRVPEAFVAAIRRVSISAPPWHAQPGRRDDFLRYFDSAIDVPGADSELIGQAARDNLVHLVVGVSSGTVARSTAPR